ncbi:MAG: nuclear transport factor 2 family protein [Acidobacteria bacterium]|nr:nuclear transport factor 2 family protein [Acidobacteriota bacterium]
MTDLSSHDQILAAREAINRAIAARDPQTIASFLLPTYHVVTARSMHRDGQEASVKSWADLFAHDPAAVYTRIAEQIHINDGWGMAQEHGRWTGTITTKTGLLEVSGVYAAKWHLAAEGWRLEAEIFTPLVVMGP